VRAAPSDRPADGAPIMTIHVQLFAYLSKFSLSGQEKFQLEVGPDATVGWLLGNLKIPPDFERMVLVNGRRANPETRLAEGDDVFIFPPAAGG
jgi:molybdopterin converting factor small subunit